MKYLMIYLACFSIIAACNNSDEAESEEFRRPPPNSGSTLEIQRVNDALDVDTTKYLPPEIKTDSSE